MPDEEDSKHAAGSHNESASGAELSAATRTGNSLAERPRPSRPARYSRHQLKTKLALTPCARATRATDAPSAKASWTICSFVSNGRNCRLLAAFPLV